MNVLVADPDLAHAMRWACLLEGADLHVHYAHTVDDAIGLLRQYSVDAVVLSLSLPGGCPVNVADFALYRSPDAKVVFVSENGEFSDGSIFTFSHNAAAYLPAHMAPPDMAAIVQYHAAAR